MIIHTDVVDHQTATNADSLSTTETAGLKKVMSRLADIKRFEHLNNLGSSPAIVLEYIQPMPSKRLSEELRDLWDGTVNWHRKSGKLGSDRLSASDIEVRHSRAASIDTGRAAWPSTAAIPGSSG